MFLALFDPTRETLCCSTVTSTIEGNPRGRGGDFSVVINGAIKEGQSPRARGRRLLDVGVGDLTRAIPAGAGETVGRHRPCCACRGNPRGRGGDLLAWRTDADQGGQSPRARGRLSAIPAGTSSEGAIPAGAGETTGVYWWWAPGRGNPRGRGGDCPGRSSWETWEGQSPRARGRRGIASLSVRDERAIPAGAGETGWSWCGSSGSRGNPRGRGGDCDSNHENRSSWGQSPRARGRRNENEVAKRQRGAIPAGAGETAFHLLLPFEEMGNPRGRGGDTLHHIGCGVLMGQSPRARGRPTVRHGPQCREGAIPAGAGETDLRGSGAIEQEGNPRGRGGDEFGNQERGLAWGQSPRARGRRLCL